jgi:hypothetical protein
MAFNVQDFRAEMVGDGARPNLFACSLNNLPVVGAGNSSVADSNKKFNFMCRAAQLPGATIGAIPVNYFGRELKFAGNRTFTEWTVTIINDEDFVIRNAMEQWMHNINSHVANLRAGTFVNPQAYQTDGIATQYGKAGNIIKKYDFIGMFPIDVSPIELDWGANDQIEEFAVTFAYQWWESNTTDTA